MIAIKNVKIYPVTGPVIEKGTILLENGKIHGIGEHLDIPKDAEVFDGEGKQAFPGFIDAHCHLGMWESAIGFEGDDGNEMTDPITPVSYTHLDVYKRQGLGRSRGESSYSGPGWLWGNANSSLPGF